MADSSSSPTPAPSSSLLSKGVQESDDRPHVLVVDDSLIDRGLMERVFNSYGCKVTTAENGQEALEFLGLGDAQCANSRGSNVNLIITDYSMPRVTGFELLKKVKESSSLKEIPVVIVSSEDIPSRIRRCREAGAQEFLLKPLKIEDIEKLRFHMT